MKKDDDYIFWLENMAILLCRNYSAFSRCVDHDFLVKHAFRVVIDDPGFIYAIANINEKCNVRSIIDLDVERQREETRRYTQMVIERPLKRIDLYRNIGFTRNNAGNPERLTSAHYDYRYWLESLVVLLCKNYVDYHSILLKELPLQYIAHFREVETDDIFVQYAIAQINDHARYINPLPDKEELQTYLDRIVRASHV